MDFLTIQVSGIKTYVIARKKIPAGIIGAQVRFEFDDTWDGLTKTAVFRGCVTKDVLIDSEVVTIPAETVARPLPELEIGVYGVNADGTIAIPTLWAKCGRVRDATDPSGDTSTDPTLPVWAQLQSQINELREHPHSSGLPDVTEADDGKMLLVENGEWQLVPSSRFADGGLPADAATLLITILSNAVYITDQSGNIKLLAAMLGVKLEDDSEEPAVPDDPELPKLDAPVIRIEAELEKLAAPVIHLETATDEGDSDSDTDETTPAILGVAILGRTILGDYGKSDSEDSGELTKLDTPVIRLEADLPKLDAPVIRLETDNNGEEIPKLDAPVISLESDPEDTEEEPTLTKLGTPVIRLEADLPKLSAPVIALETVVMVLDAPVIELVEV